MEKIERYILGKITTNGCNLKCDYCYLKLQRTKSEGVNYDYSFDVIEQAMRKERWGVCLISLTGDGETLLDDSVIELTRRLLKNGHYINIVNNGTQTKNLNKMIETFSEDYRERVMLTFSLHYIELKRQGLLENFFENVNKMKKAGFTIFVHMVLAEQYIEIIEEIKTTCMKYMGTLPHIGMVRDETRSDKRDLYASISEEEYFSLGNQFNSALFNLQEKLYKMGKIEQYCYAGELGIVLNFSTGYMRQCICNYEGYNVFEAPVGPVHFKVVGESCGSPWCFCETFQVLGMVPELELEGYSEAFDSTRADWVSNRMKEALSVKLADKYIKS